MFNATAEQHVSQGSLHAVREEGVVNQPRSGSAVIVGLGQTGVSCARFLARRGVDFRVVDSRTAPPALEALGKELPHVPVQLGAFDPRLLQTASELIVSPGVSLRDPAIAEAALAGVPVAGDVELFARIAGAPVVAVTGSNGKSTVTALMGELATDQGLTVAVGGNIGTPVLDLLNDPEPDLYVLELSSFQLETTRSLNAAVATVLNVSADHMDRYMDLADYTQAKARIFRGSGVMVVNRDDPRVRAMIGEGRSVLGFGLGSPAGRDFGLAAREGALWLVRGAEALMPVRELRIRGLHNAANALASLALGEGMGFSLPAMLETLRRFPGLPHRCEWVARQGGVDWYNDSKGTNVGASLAAIRGLDVTGRLVLIAGGDGKRADFLPLREVVAARARAAVLIGRDGPRIEQALGAVVPVRRARDMEEAVTIAAALALPGDAVLLSPACASFDMFTDYRARGDAFTAAVRGRAGL